MEIKKPIKFERVNLGDHILPSLKDVFKRTKPTVDEIWESMSSEEKKECLRVYGMELDYKENYPKSCREDLPKEQEILGEQK